LATKTAEAFDSRLAWVDTRKDGFYREIDQRRQI